MLDELSIYEFKLVFIREIIMYYHLVYCDHGIYAKLGQSIGDVLLVFVALFLLGMHPILMPIYRRYRGSVTIHRNRRYNFSIYIIHLELSRYLSATIRHEKQAFSLYGSKLDKNMLVF